MNGFPTSSPADLEKRSQEQRWLVDGLCRRHRRWPAQVRQVLPGAGSRRRRRHALGDPRHRCHHPAPATPGRRRPTSLELPNGLSSRLSPKPMQRSPSAKSCTLRNLPQDHRHHPPQARPGGVTPARQRGLHQPRCEPVRKYRATLRGSRRSRLGIRGGITFGEIAVNQCARRHACRSPPRFL